MTTLLKGTSMPSEIALLTKPEDVKLDGAPSADASTTSGTPPAKEDQVQKPSEPKKEVSWDERMAKAKEKKSDSSAQSEEKSVQLSNEQILKELAELKKSNESLKKEREIAVKRQSDTHRAFHEKTKELNALKEAQKSAESKPKGDDKSTSEKELKLADLGLSEDAMEMFEDYNGMKEFAEKALAKINEQNKAISEVERRKENQRIAELEKEVKQSQAVVEKEWLEGAKKIMPQLDSVIDDPEFNLWIDANPTTVQKIREGKDAYDPRWLAQTAMAFHNEKTYQHAVRTGNQKVLSQMIAPENVGIPSDSRKNNDGKSWEERYKDAQAKKARQLKGL